MNLYATAFTALLIASVTASAQGIQPSALSSQERLVALSVVKDAKLGRAIELHRLDEEHAALRVFKDGRQAQELLLDLFLPEPAQPTLEFVDINGDGAKDVIVVTATNGIGQEFQDAFLWNKKSNSLVRSSEISGRGSIEAQLQRGCIDVTFLCRARAKQSSETFCWTPQEQRWRSVNENSSCD